jgi:hypothetical protein
MVHPRAVVGLCLRGQEPGLAKLKVFLNCVHEGKGN